MIGPQSGRKETSVAPGPLKQFWWDLLPKNSPDWLVPRQSGLKPPEANLEWLTSEIAEKLEALEQTRRAHDLERERAQLLEAKATGMVTLCLTLLATALALGGYQVGILRGAHRPNWLLIVPAALSVACLVFAAITSLEVQRVGIYQWEGAEPFGRDPDGRLGIVRAEETGRQLARWTAGIKVNGYLQARAWLSRAIVALIASAIVTIGMATGPI